MPKLKIIEMKFMVRSLLPRATGVFFIIMALFSSCSSIQDPVSEKEKQAFIGAYSDLILIRLKHGGHDKAYQRAEEAVFEKYNLTK